MCDNILDENLAASESGGGGGGGGGGGAGGEFGVDVNLRGRER